MDARTGLRCAIAIGLAALLAGCALDLARMRASPPPVSAPALRRFESDSAELQAPEGLLATSGELRAVPLKWEPVLVGDVGGYWIERASARDGSFEPIAKVSGRLATTYLDLDAIRATAPVAAGAEDDAESDSTANPRAVGADGADGVTWFYRVRAYSVDGLSTSPASSLAVATTAPPPKPPEDLRAYSRQPREVPLSWRASDDPDVVGYRVERSPTARGPFELLAELDGRYDTVYVDRGLGDLRVFYYRVLAVNAAGGLGIATEPARAVTKPEPLPPIGLRTAEQRLGSNGLVWEPNVEDDIVEYRLFRGFEGDDAPSLIANLESDETAATDAAVAAGQRVYYQLTAIDRDGLESDFGDPIDVESEGYGLSATARSDGVHLAWIDRAHEGYRGGHVFRTALLQNKNLGFSLGNDFVDPDVKPGSTYRYTVVLERLDQSLAPRSMPVEITIPESAAD